MLVSNLTLRDCFNERFYSSGIDRNLMTWRTSQSFSDEHVFSKVLLK